MGCTVARPGSSGSNRKTPSSPYTSTSSVAQQRHNGNNRHDHQQQQQGTAFTGSVQPTRSIGSGSSSGGGAGQPGAGRSGGAGGPDAIRRGFLAGTLTPDSRCPLDARQMYGLTKTWKAINRNMSVTAINIFVRYTSPYYIYSKHLRHYIMQK